MMKMARIRAVSPWFQEVTGIPMAFSILLVQVLIIGVHPLIINLKAIPLRSEEAWDLMEVFKPIGCQKA